MLETLGNILGDAHFEAYVGGPLAGVVAAAIFSSLGKTPAIKARRDLSPEDVQTQLHSRPVINRTIHHHYHAQPSSSSSENGPALLFGAVIVLVLGVFLFSAFLPQIAKALYFFITAVAMFSITSSLLAIITRQFNDPQWWLHAIIPSIVSIGCFWLTDIAYKAINPSVVRYAQDLLGSGHFTFSLIITSAFTFFKSIHNQYVTWMLLDMAAFLCILICVAISLLQCVFYVSLSNTRESNSSFWLRLALMTERFSKTGVTIFMLLFLILGWALASGHIYQLTH